MITYESLNHKLSMAIQNDGDLKELKKEYTTNITKLHMFIDMFLEKFGNKVIGEKNNSPEWRLFSQKSEEYNNYARAIRNIDYWIAKKAISER